MANIGSVLTPVAMAAVINGISKYKTNGPAGTFQVVFANAALFTMLASIGNFLDWEIAQAFAIVYLIATFLTAGAPFIEWIAALVSGPKSPASSKQSPKAKAN